MNRGALAAIAVLALLGAPASAAGDDAFTRASPASVTWSAPPECPPGSSVEEAVRALLASSTRLADDAARVEARVTVTRSRDGRYRAEVKTFSQGIHGARRFRAATCTSLAEATALLLALMIDPGAVAAAGTAGATVERPTPVPPVPVSPSSPPAIAPAERPVLGLPTTSTPSRPWHLSPRLHAAAAFDVGSLPTAAVGVEVGAGVDYGPLLLALDVGLWPTGSLADGGGTLTMASGQLSLCEHPLSRVPVWTCAGQSWTHLSGSFPGQFETAPSQTGDTAAFVAGLLAEPRLGPVGLMVRAEGVVFYRRPSFLGEDQAALFRPAPAAFRGFVGLAVHFL